MDASLSEMLATSTPSAAAVPFAGGLEFPDLRPPSFLCLDSLAFPPFGLDLPRPGGLSTFPSFLCLCFFSSFRGAADELPFALDGTKAAADRFRPELDVSLTDPAFSSDASREELAAPRPLPRPPRPRPLVDPRPRLPRPRPRRPPLPSAIAFVRPAQFLMISSSRVLTRSTWRRSKVSPRRSVPWESLRPPRHPKGCLSPPRGWSGPSRSAPCATTPGFLSLSLAFQSSPRDPTKSSSNFKRLGGNQGVTLEEGINGGEGGDVEQEGRHRWTQATRTSGS